jgi:tRNA A37 threonylcarbamoyladenosine synthetase subunit TsaC/SUA5/YrdC
VRIISLEKFLEEEDHFLEEAQRWKIFVYPTDTIYWVWSIITPYAIKTIDMIKQRKSWKHYSIIAPNFQRVEEHFAVENFEKYRTNMKSSLQAWRWLTVLCSIKDIYADSVWVVSSNQKVGIRIIDHPIQSFVRELWQSFITTSANISWNADAISHPSHLTKEQSWLIDYFIYSEKHQSQSSRIIDREGWEIIRE